MSQKGFGLRQLTDRRYAQFSCAMAQSIPQLFDRKDDRGNAIGGRLPIPGLVRLFRKNSFDSPTEDPWKHLTRHSERHHCLSNGLQCAWSHLKISFQEVATSEQKRDDSLLLNQKAKNAGFLKKGALSHSVTKALTKELESARSIDLGKKLIGSLDRTHYKRWS